MARACAISATLALPCAAFVQQGNLRAQPQARTVAEVAEARAQVGVPSVSEAGQGRLVGAFAGVAACGLAIGAARAVEQRRSSNRTERRVVGVCLPLSEKFDPLNLSDTEEKLEKYTVAEIKHGRVAMLACVGYVLPEIFRFPGCESFEHGLGALSSIPTEGLVQLFVFIGLHDVLVKPRAGGLNSSDFGFGSEVLEGLSDYDIEYRQTAERNNGRLAMVAIIGIMWQEATFGKTPLALIKTDGFWGPSVDIFIKDIPICNGTSFCAEAEEVKMSPSVPYLTYPKVLDGWVGGEKGFDPLQVTDALPVYLVREAELKHGRVCMLATVGWIATDLGVRFPGEQFQDISTIEAHDKMVEAGIMGPFLASIAVAEIYAGWLCLEGFSGKISRQAGDFFLGKNFLPADEAKANDMKLKELENGRLAMLAFSGICTQAVLTSKGFPYF